ncbi:CLUMA_CG012543, isoform A [Clunio marinus]|uniref:CLUMA_CG012543, isoform A n=1 Tax=Clunio marinus TaxID=568069 RepID=A0A1J1IFZ1_9DIPT|nr:CLUMA_CG012543, isoform A [Clunio marinus]
MPPTSTIKVHHKALPLITVNLSGVIAINHSFFDSNSVLILGYRNESAKCLTGTILKQFKQMMMMMIIFKC